MKQRFIGLYVGGLVDPEVDPYHFCGETKKAGYTGIVLFATTVFFAKMAPWMLQGQRYLFSVINPDYRAHFRRWCQAARSNGITLHLKIVDQFHDYGSNPGPDWARQAFGFEAASKLHQNAPATHLEAVAAHNERVNAKAESGKPHPDWDEEQLYASYADGKKTWLLWSDTKDPKYFWNHDGTIDYKQTLTQFKTVGPFGEGMQRFLEMMARILKDTGVDFSLCWSNETLAYRDPVTGKVTNARGDRDEVVIWLRALFASYGLNGYDYYFDYLCLNKGRHKGDKDYVDVPTVRKAFDAGVRKKHRANLEIHGILSWADVEKFKFKPAELNYVLPSSDGDLNMAGDYPGMYDSPAPKFDLKMDSRHVTATTVTQFFNGLIPRYKGFARQ